MKVWLHSNLVFIIVFVFIIKFGFVCTGLTLNVLSSDFRLS